MKSSRSGFSMVPVPIRLMEPSADSMMNSDGSWLISSAIESALTSGTSLALAMATTLAGEPSDAAFGSEGIRPRKNRTAIRTRMASATRLTRKNFILLPRHYHGGRGRATDCRRHPKKPTGTERGNPNFRKARKGGASGERSVISGGAALIRNHYVRRRRTIASQHSQRRSSLAYTPHKLLPPFFRRGSLRSSDALGSSANTQAPGKNHILPSIEGFS